MVTLEEYWRIIYLCDKRVEEIEAANRQAIMEDL
jgi:hypothetical protein